MVELWLCSVNDEHDTAWYQRVTSDRTVHMRALPVEGRDTKCSYDDTSNSGTYVDSADPILVSVVSLGTEKGREGGVDTV